MSKRSPEVTICMPAQALAAQCFLLQDPCKQCQAAEGLARLRPFDVAPDVGNPGLAAGIELLDLRHDHRAFAVCRHYEPNQPARHRIFGARAVPPHASKIAHMLGLDHDHAV
jgi:hypothetical protein